MPKLQWYTYACFMFCAHELKVAAEIFTLCPIAFAGKPVLKFRIGLIWSVAYVVLWKKGGFATRRAEAPMAGSSAKNTPAPARSTVFLVIWYASPSRGAKLFVSVFISERRRC